MYVSMYVELIIYNVFCLHKNDKINIKRMGILESKRQNV